MSNVTTKIKYDAQVTLKNVDVRAFQRILEPALLFGDQITFNINLESGEIYGFSGGSDKFKFWNAPLTQICEKVEFGDGYTETLPVKTVIMQTRALLNVMNIVGANIDVEINLKKHTLVYEAKGLTLRKDRLTLEYACGLLSVGQPDITEEKKAERLGSFGETHEFEMPVQVLGRIKQLSNIQTLEKKIDNITFTSQDGFLRICNDVFDDVFESIYVGEMPEYKFKTEVFGLIDNDNYNVTITRNPRGIKKIMFFSKDRDIKFVSSLLAKVDDVEDSGDISNEFAAFANGGH
ncbi:hypothetical protein MA9V1_137 [Chryseobacterium phage MA9V-1]|nr:hypothetical protein MA9V1_137 [Chryseobacterium phage MA9V-1]